MDHPFTQSTWRKSAGVAALLLLSTLMFVLIVLYGNISATTAFADSLFYTGILALVAYFYWYVIGFFQVFQSKVIAALAAQLVCLVITLALLLAFELEDFKTFSYLIPVRMSVSTLTWIILQQWYDINKATKKEAEEEAEEEGLASQHIETVERIDRISVKDGSKIHLITANELIYIQAYGDYVTLFTKEGKYVKELTMKYLEANLPDSFIRIHRSYIVNTSHIIRIELFGKETYQVRLKDNTCLRISNNGYKLLKDRLLL
ncbi:MAG: LytTR family transcriptional regulator [Prevotellaceae bacterium]|jgi:DNA-binding LytR/AlgR family response regulator|nr:LytTR family transcriptional regulator [Prevotellaceae bacterium]